MPNYALKWSDPGGNGSINVADAAGDVVRNVYELNWSEAPLRGVTLLANDIVDLGILPANHIVTDVTIDTDDMDSNATPTLAFDIGIVTGTPGDTVSARTCGNEFFAADTTARTGGMTRMTRQQGLRVAPAAFDRSIGLRVTTAAATQASTTTGRIRIIVEMQG